MHEFSGITQIGGHLIFKGGPGASLTNVNGFSKLRVMTTPDSKQSFIADSTPMRIYSQRIDVFGALCDSC